MAPNGGSNFRNPPSEDRESCVNAVDNSHLLQMEVINDDNPRKTMYFKSYQHRAFTYDGDSGRTARCFQEQHRCPDLKEDDNYADKSTDYAGDGNRERALTQFYKHISLKPNREMFKDDVILNQEVSGDSETTPPLGHKNTISTALESCQGETVTERGKTTTAAGDELTDTPGSYSTPDSDVQIGYNEDGRDISERQGISRSFSVNDSLEAWKMAKNEPASGNFRLQTRDVAAADGQTKTAGEQYGFPHEFGGALAGDKGQDRGDEPCSFPAYREGTVHTTWRGSASTLPIRESQEIPEHDPGHLPQKLGPSKEQNEEDVLSSYDDDEKREISCDPVARGEESCPGEEPPNEYVSTDSLIESGDLDRLFREDDRMRSTQFRGSTLMQPSWKRYNLSLPSLACLQESLNKSDEYLERFGNARERNIGEASQPEDRIEHVSGRSNLHSVTVNRGGSPTQIDLSGAKKQIDESSTATNRRKMTSLFLKPVQSSLKSFTEKQQDDPKQRSENEAERYIVTAKLLDLMRNVHKAFENLLQRVNLEFADGPNKDLEEKPEYSRKVTGVKKVRMGNRQDVLKAQKLQHFMGSQSKFSARVKTFQFQEDASKSMVTSNEEDSISEQNPLKCELMIQIVRDGPQNQYQNDYQWDDTIVGKETGSFYVIKMSGISENQVQSRLKHLQEDFDSFPSYRRWRYGIRAPKRVEFYTISRGQKAVSFHRVCRIDVRGINPGQCRVYESKIQEVPQFVENMQPRPGSISDIASDPPGQQSVYISPGDHRQEAYRLSTFESFPRRTPINVPDLAKYGFFYTGFYDRVKCYSCGRTVEKWTPGDSPVDKRWHKQDCLLARGVANDNIPIGGRFSSALFNSPLSGASTSIAQPMEVGQSHSQHFNNSRLPGGVDVTDLTRSGGTYQMLPNSTFVIGPTSVQTHQAPLPARLPANNPPPRQWRMANVVSADHKRHLTNLYLNRELDRLASFGRWPIGRPNVSPVDLARAGFFYLGDMDRTQCFSCGGVLRNWSADDDAMVEHRTHFQNCRIVAGLERRNVPIPQQPETPMELAEKFPCRFPMNPHMRSEPSRLATFDRRWPADRIRAQPQEIAEAGFFFLGERDRVKCWYCNGGLQNWEYDDVPWIEHAKWFPNCQFLVAKQGQLFVYRYLSLSPHLPRPIIGRQDGASVDPSTATVHTGSGQSSGAQDVASPPASRVRAPSPPPAIIDPQEEFRKRRERVEKELKESDMAKVVLAMGYDENLVRRTLPDGLESGHAHDANDIYEGTAALLDAVMEKEAEIETEREQEQATSIKFPTMSSTYSAVAMESIDTSPSGPPSGLHQVSGFDDDDEDRDLYSSIVESPSSGAVGGATNAPVASAGSERRMQHIWKDIPEDQESMKEYIEQKKEERLCKICFDKSADMVFIPCSHMCCCMSCTEAIRHCPICRKKIEKAIKTYLK